jgi:hypothetical protein
MGLTTLLPLRWLSAVMLILIHHPADAHYFAHR